MQKVFAVLGPAVSGSCSDEEIAVFLPARSRVWEVSGIWAVRTWVAFPCAEPDPVLGAGMGMAAFGSSRELGILYSLGAGITEPWNH